MNNERVYHWKQEYGDRFGKFDSDEGGNFSIYYPWFKKLNFLRKGMSFFSIGGGYGTLEAHIARDFEATFGFLEPTLSLFEKAQERFDRFGVLSQQAENRQGTFQDFECKNQYDLVFAIHSWYYVGFFEEQIRKALSMLKENGRFVLVLSSSRSWDKSILSSLGSSDTFLTFENVKDWTDLLQIRSKLHTQPKAVPLTSFVRERSATAYAQDWITYLGRTPWSDIPNAKQQNLIQLYEELASNGELKSTIGLLEYPASS